VRYVNNALAALDDFHLRRGLGKADIGREDIPKTAPKAMDANAQIRWLRAIEVWPRPATALWPCCRSTPGCASVTPSPWTCPTCVSQPARPARCPFTPQLRHPLLGWLDVRLTWPGAATQRALFLNRRGGSLSACGASAIFTAIAQAAGLEDPTTAHIGRHTFVTQLIRGGEDPVTVAEMAGRSRLDTLRIYSQPTDDDE
jgi:integrase/recombinase XerC